MASDFRGGCGVDLLSALGELKPAAANLPWRMTMQRYDNSGEDGAMEKDACGGWVDAGEAEARIRELEAERDVARSNYEAVKRAYDAALKRAEAAEAESQQYKKALQEIADLPKNIRDGSRGDWDCSSYEKARRALATASPPAQPSPGNPLLAQLAAAEKVCEWASTYITNDEVESQFTAAVLAWEATKSTASPPAAPSPREPRAAQ